MGMFDWLPAMPTFFKSSTPETAPPQPSNTPLGVAPSVGARRKRTYRNKEKRPAKRRRNGRKSIRS